MMINLLLENYELERVGVDVNDSKPFEVMSKHQVHSLGNC
jgi:hypothetical protein